MQTFCGKCGHFRQTSKKGVVRTGLCESQVRKFSWLFVDELAESCRYYMTPSEKEEQRAKALEEKISKE